MRQLTEFEKGFLVGLIEGHNAISLLNNKHADRTEANHAVPAITLCGQKPFVERLMRIVPGSRIVKAGNVGEKRHLEVWTWFISRQSVVRELLPQIIEHLVVNRERADVVLRFLEARSRCGRREPYGEAELTAIADFAKLKRGH